MYRQLQDDVQGAAGSASSAFGTWFLGRRVERGSSFSRSSLNTRNRLEAARYARLTASREVFPSCCLVWGWIGVSAGRRQSAACVLCRPEDAARPLHRDAQSSRPSVLGKVRPRSLCFWGPRATFLSSPNPAEMRREDLFREKWAVGKGLFPPGFCPA